MADVNARANLDVNVTGESEIDKLNKKLNQKRKPVTINVTEKIKSVRSGSTAKQNAQAATAMRRAQSFQAKQQAAAARANAAANRVAATAALTQAANAIRAAARALYRAAVSLRTGIQGSVAGQARVGNTNRALQAQIQMLTRAVQAANRQNLTRASARGGGGPAAPVGSAARTRAFRRRVSMSMRGNSEQLEEPIEIAFSIIRLASVAGAKIGDILSAGLGRALTPMIDAMQRIGPRFNRLGAGFKRLGGTMRMTANVIGGTVAGLSALTAVLGVTTVYLGATAGINAIKKMLAGINEIAIQATNVAANARLYGTSTGAQNRIENTLRGLPGLVDDTTVQKFLKEYQDKMRKSIDDSDEFEKNFGAKDGSIKPKQLFGFDHKEFKALNKAGGTGVIPFLQLMEKKLREIKDPAKLATALDTIRNFSEEMATVLNNALNRKPGELIKRAEEEGSNRRPIDTSLGTKFQQDYQFAVNAVNDLLAAISERLFKPLGDKLVSFQKILQGDKGKAFEDAAVEKIKLIADSIDDFLNRLEPQTIGNAVKSVGDLVNALVIFGEKTVEVAGRVNDFFRGLEDSALLRAAGFDFRSEESKRKAARMTEQNEIVKTQKQLADLERLNRNGRSDDSIAAVKKRLEELTSRFTTGVDPQGPPAPAATMTGEQAGAALIEKLRASGEAVGSLFGAGTIQALQTGSTTAGQAIGGAATQAMQAQAGAIGAAIGAAIAAAIRGAIPAIPGGAGAGSLNRGSDGPVKG